MLSMLALSNYKALPKLWNGSAAKFTKFTARLRYLCQLGPTCSDSCQLGMIEKIIFNCAEAIKYQTKARQQEYKKGNGSKKKSTWEERLATKLSETIDFHLFVTKVTEFAIELNLTV